MNKHRRLERLFNKVLAKIKEDLYNQMLINNLYGVAEMSICGKTFKLLFRTTKSWDYCLSLAAKSIK